MPERDEKGLWFSHGFPQSSRELGSHDPVKETDVHGNIFLVDVFGE